MANKLINLFNKVVKNEIAVSNYFNSKRTSSLQNSTINSPATNITIGSGNIGIIGNTTGGNLGKYEVEDRGTEYLVSIEAGSMNGISWTATDIVIPKASIEGETSSVIYYVYVDSINKNLVLSQITESSTPETTNFVLMVVLVPDNPEGFIKGYTTEENITSFIYGYQANFYYYLFLMSNVAIGNTFAIDAGKITGNLIIDGNLTVTSASDSVLITSDGMYIYDVANVTSLGLDGNYTQSLLATFNKNGLFFYDGAGTVLSKFTKDEATIAGWTINADSLSGPNIILYADGGMQTADFAEGVIGEIGNEEGWVKGIGWKIGSDGSAYFNDVVVFGTLYSSMGNIAGWEITEDYIANGNIVLASKGEIYTASYIPEVSGWKIRYDGLAEFNNAIIRGTLFSEVGYIGNWNIASGIISSHSATHETVTSNSAGTVTLTSDAVALIYVRDLNTGQLYQQDQVTFIAPRTIEGLQADTEHVVHYITSYDGIKLDSGGSISANYVANSSGWSINSIGDAEFNTILIRGGDFQNGELGGNWSVTEDGKLQNGTDIVLDGANKTIYFNNKSTYSADTTTGIFMGYDSGIPKVNIGSDSAFLKWTGTELLISGNITANSGNIGGWTINPTTLSATNIILDSTGTIKTADFVEGSFSTATQIEDLTSTGAGEIALTYTVESIISVTVSGEAVTYTFVPQSNSLTNLAPLTLHHIEYVKQTTSLGTGWKIDSTGDAYFNDVTIFGTLYSTGGNIGGWSIGEGYIANGNIVLASSGEIYTANYNHRISGWKIRYDGFAEFNNVLVRGEIESGSGNIGGWLITPTTIESEGTIGIIMDSTGSIGSKNFVIDTSGWKIFGDGTAEFGNIIVRSGSLATTGALDGWTVGEGKLYNSTDIVLDANSKRIYLNNKNSYTSVTAGIFMGYDTDAYKVAIGTDTSYLKWDGTALTISGEITATTGDIGGWDIGATTLSSNSLTLTSGENPYIGIGTTSYSGAGIWLGKSTSWKASFYADANNYLLWDGAKLTIKAANFELDASGNITASSVDLTGKITATTGTIAGWTIDGGLLKNGTDVVLDATNKKIYFNNKSSYASAIAGIFMGYDTDAYKVAIGTDTSYLKWTGTELLISGNITANSGTIAGWTIAPNNIYSGNVYIRSDKSRFEINVDSVAKLAMGYLDGIGAFTSTDFGIYVGAADAIYIEAPTEGNEVIHQIKGDWIVKHDANIIINSTVDGVDLEVLRLGKYGTERGLYLFDALGAVLASYTSSGVTINVAGTNMKIGNDVESTNDGIYINSTNYWYSDGSFKIGSTNSYIAGSSSGIAITSPNFTVNTLGTITAQDGTIGGWTIASTSISSNSLTLTSGTSPYIGIGTTTYGNAGIWLGGNTAGDPPVTTWKASFYADANNYLLWDGAKLTIKAANFTLDANGKITATSANISGSITSSSGTIGGWTINPTTLSAANITLDSTGSIKANYTAGSTGWSINSAGDAEFNNVVIRATGGTLGSVTGWSIQEGFLQDSAATIKLDAANKKITVGNYVALGSNVKTANYIGLKITDANYWETNGTYTNFALGTKLSYTDSSGTGVLSVEGEVKATSGYIGGSSSGWHIATNELYYGTSSNIYSIKLDGNNTRIGIHSLADNLPSIRLGYNVVSSGLHGLAFYNSSTSLNNYWVWDTNLSKIKFKVGDSTNYLDFNVGTASKLTIKTDTFNLATTNLTIDSAAEKIAMGSIVLQGSASPYIGIGTTSYSGAGIWLGKDTTWKASFYADANNYLKWTGSALDINVNAGVFRVTTTGALTATNATITGNITANSGTIGGTVGGWTIGTGTLQNGTDIVLNATAKQITIASGAIKLGIDVNSTNDGLYINATNYWYSDGSFKIGSTDSYITGSSSGIAINSTNFTVDTAGTIMAKSGTIGGWKLGTSQLYAGDSITTYSILLDATSSYIGINKATGYTSPLVKIGMSAYDGDHGLAFYTSTGAINNYWVWDNSSMRFKVGDSTNYLDFNVGTANKLTIKTDTFNLSSTNFNLISGAYPYLGINAQKFMGTGVFTGKGAKEIITPNMTANNVMAFGDGTYIASDSSSSTTAWYVFNDSPTTYKSLSVNSWAKIELPVRKIVYSYNLYATSSLYYIKGWKLQGSNDDTTWVTLDEQSGHASWTGKLASDIEIASPAPYLYYRLLITEVNKPTYLYARVAMIYLYDKEGYKFSAVGSGDDPNYISFNSANEDGSLSIKANIFSLSTAGLTIGAAVPETADYLTDGIWMGYHLGGMIYTPMTSNILPAGQRAYDENGSSTAYYVFDNSLDTYKEYVVGEWVALELPRKKTAVKYRIYSSSINFPTAWNVQGSVDGIEWTTLNTQSSVTPITGWSSYYTISLPKAYKYYRFNVTAVGGTTGTSARLYSIDFSDESSYNYFSIGSSSTGNNFMWNGDALSIKGDLYVGAGENGIYFEDSKIFLGDNIIESSTNAHYIRYVANLPVNDYPNIIIHSLGFTVDSDTAPTVFTAERTFQNRFYSYSDPAYIKESLGHYAYTTSYDFYSSSSIEASGYLTVGLYQSSDANSIAILTDMPAKFMIPEWYGTDTSAIAKYPSISSWTDPENCPISNIWTWKKSSGTPYRVLYIRLPDGSIWWVDMNLPA